MEAWKNKKLAQGFKNEQSGKPGTHTQDYLEQKL